MIDNELDTQYQLSASTSTFQNIIYNPPIVITKGRPPEEKRTLSFIETMSSNTLKRKIEKLSLEESGENQEVIKQTKQMRTLNITDLKPTEPIAITLSKKKQSNIFISNIQKC